MRSEMCDGKNNGFKSHIRQPGSIARIEVVVTC